MKEIETLSYASLRQLYDELQNYENEAMKNFLLADNNISERKRLSSVLTTVSNIKNIVADKLYTIWDIDNVNDVFCDMKGDQHA